MNFPNNYLSFAVLLLLFFSIPGLEQAIGQSKQVSAKSKALKIWDNKAAKTWMTEAYPIGNGRIGGMVFGGVAQEHIQFNDITLWTGNELDRGMYQAFGDLYFNFEKAQGDASDYHRELDLNNSVHQVTYTLNGVKYRREYFCSFPDQVIVMRLTASKKGAYSGTLNLKDAHQAKVTGNGNNTLQIAGSLSNGMRYQASAQVKTEAGNSEIISDGKGGMELKVSNADAITIFFSAATDFANDRLANWKGEAPASKIQKILASATVKSYATLLNNHISDYQSLFGRVRLNLGKSSAEILAQPIHQRLINYKKTTDPQLESLIFQYGRYLLISSSRKGGLPANLQGLWNESNMPPWGSDYHTNINIQMNYWLAEPTNLSECHFPYLDHINAIRDVRKINTQKEYPGVRGWTLRTESNPFGGESYLWNTPGSAW
ncbi:MAG: glycoside hydrolase family 95 protein, partial [Pedobacter sp.]